MTSFLCHVSYAQLTCSHGRLASCLRDSRSSSRRLDSSIVPSMLCPPLHLQTHVRRHAMRARQRLAKMRALTPSLTSTSGRFRCDSVQLRSHCLGAGPGSVTASKGLAMRRACWSRHARSSSTCRARIYQPPRRTRYLKAVHDTWERSIICSPADAGGCGSSSPCLPHRAS